MSFLDVVEVGGAEVAPEQMLRTYHRYYWAEQYCRGKDVLEVACGSGIGLPFLKSVSRSVSAGDYAQDVLDLCRERVGEGFDLKQFDAQDMPYETASMDAIILFEAIYYLASVDAFVAECRRVLRPGGVVLIATANNKLWDFTPSAFSTRYLNTTDLRDVFQKGGFSIQCFGFISVQDVSLRQKVLRPAKALASRLNLIPKSMRGKELLKKLFFGSLVSMPPFVEAGYLPYEAPTPIPTDRDDVTHKTLYCAAHLPATPSN